MKKLLFPGIARQSVGHCEPPLDGAAISYVTAALLFLLICLPIIGSTTAWAAGPSLPQGGTSILYVDDNAPLDPGPGISFISDPLEDGSALHPFDSLAEALTTFANHDHILVRDGMYAGQGNSQIVIKGKAVPLRSENGADSCTINGQGFPFLFQLQQSHVLLEGFTFAGTRVPILLADDGELTLRHCQVRCDIMGPGTLRVPCGSRLLIQEFAQISLWEQQRPALFGNFFCDGFLFGQDDAGVFNCNLRLAAGELIDRAGLVGCQIEIDQRPGRGLVLRDQSQFHFNHVTAGGNHYVRVDAQRFQGQISNNDLFLNIDE